MLISGRKDPGVVRIAADKAGPRVVMFAGIHGDEA